MTESVVRVVVADDHPVYRLGLCALIDSTAGFRVVGQASTGTEAAEVAEEVGPDVIIMDQRMPGLTGTQATRRILRSRPDTAILMLTYADDNDSVIDALLAGALGYVLKDASHDDILCALEDVARGRMVLGPTIANRVAGLVTRGSLSPGRPFPELTNREFDVLRLMASGLDNHIIAARLGVGDKRVRNCVSDIYTKLHVTDRAEAIVRARQAGLGQPDTTAS
jgi:DNA-binding NarL/FixJ family response regulator